MQKKTVGIDRIQDIRLLTSSHLHSVLQTCDPKHKQLLYNAIEKLYTCDIQKHAKCSFTLNKRVIYLKLENLHGVPYEDCVIVKVLIHELVHMLQAQYGHDDEFWRINRILYPARFGCTIPADYACITDGVEGSLGVDRHV